MFEMSDSSKHHGHVVAIAIINGSLVFDASTWLNHGFYTGFIGDFYTIGKGEKRIRSQYGTFQIEPKAIGFFNGLL